MAVRVRLADPDRDAEAVAAIYAPAVLSTTATFEEVAPDAAEMARRMRGVLVRTPWLVAESDVTVVGYAYAAPHRERAGYRWSVDISVYVDAAHHGQGIGRALYDDLLLRLRSQGYVNAYAGIALPNASSVALHEKIGMHRIGVYGRVGFKFGAWHDVAWYGMRLHEADGLPPEPIPLTSVRAEPTTADAGTRRALAVDLFNHVWTLLETPDRTPLQDDEMLQAAHASRYHWGEVGEPVNLARGEWQCSRVYAVLGRAEPAMWHARRCLALCEEQGIGDFDIAFAWEAIARAASVAGDHAEADAALARARSLATAIAEDEDRELLLGDVATI